MPATNAVPGTARPIPFKDVLVVVIDNDDDDGAAAIPRQPASVAALAAEEYRGIVAALPSKLPGTPQRMRLYQGSWFREDWVLGFVAIQRHFAPRDGDVVLASLPKCGTTWLKALAFATAARAAYPPRRRHRRRRAAPAAPSQPARLRPVQGGRVLRRGRGQARRGAVAAADEHARFILGAASLRYRQPWLQNRLHMQNVEKIAEFIGQPFSDAEKEAGIVENIINLCSLQGLKASGAKNAGFRRVVNVEVPNESYFRKGAVGDWVNYVTPEMAESLDKFLTEKFRGSGFTFAE
uniref:Sulfotransferase n=3 Tax=Oryza sativa subsp. japonica TaxID=39947 RepID=Q2R7P9_ORYSJ|nr:Sulfotransferase domain, putative [Oryza sativa Japonica Group]ABA92540.1 Sulfotransferase domain containing protein [Oryza sativa Japonica Group]